MRSRTQFDAANRPSRTRTHAASASVESANGPTSGRKEGRNRASRASPSVRTRPSGSTSHR